MACSTSHGKVATMLGAYGYPGQTDVRAPGTYEAVWSGLCPQAYSCRSCASGRKTPAGGRLSALVHLDPARLLSVNESHANSSTPSPDRPHVLAVAPHAPHPCRPPELRPKHRGHRDWRRYYRSHGGRRTHGGGFARDDRRPAGAVTGSDLGDDRVAAVRNRRAADRITAPHRRRRGHYLADHRQARF
jgi:hypothetical protein